MATLVQKGPEGRHVDGPVEPVGTPSPFYANRFCPFCHKAWLAIEETGREIDYIHVDLGPTKPSWITQVNEKGSVPVLAHDGSYLTESNDIAFTVSDGTPLLPEEKKEEIKAFVQGFMPGPFIMLLKAQDEEKQAAAKTAVCGLVKKLAEQVEANGGPFLFGEQITLADLAVLPFLLRFKESLAHYRGFDILAQDGGSVLKKLIDAGLERPSVQKTTPAAKELVLFAAGMANSK